MYNYFRIAYYAASLLRHTHWTPHQLLDYQNKKVREIVDYAYDNVSFYHEKFLHSGVKPADIKTVEDLDKLPIIRREELQTGSTKLLSNLFDHTKLNTVSTSGSSGKPLLTYLTKKEDEFRKAKLLRPHIICGQNPRDKWVLIEPPQQISHLGRLQRLLGVYTPFFVSIFEDPKKQMSAVEKLRPDVLDGYSNSLFLLAKESEKNGIETIRPKMIMGGAELIETGSRKFVEETFAAPFYDQYASEELQMIAWQCTEKQEYHIDADSIVLQVVDDEGREVAPGERGEIICTSLFNYAMPFIRYAVGDMGVLSKTSDCPCGRRFPQLKVAEGRKDAMVVLQGGRRITALTLGWIMEFYRFYRDIYHYRIIQRKKDLLTFLIKTTNSQADEKSMEAELKGHVIKMLGLEKSEVRIEVEFVDEIPPDKTGKIRKVVSELSDKEAQN